MPCRGVFANVKLNQKIHQLDKVLGVYIHPGMGDEGLALGSALLSIKNPKVSFLKSVYLGPSSDNKEIELILKIQTFHLKNIQLVQFLK